MVQVMFLSDPIQLLVAWSSNFHEWFKSNCVSAGQCVVGIWRWAVMLRSFNLLLMGSFAFTLYLKKTQKNQNRWKLRISYVLFSLEKVDYYVTKHHPVIQLLFQRFCYVAQILIRNGVMGNHSHTRGVENLPEN